MVFDTLLSRAHVAIFVVITALTALTATAAIAAPAIDAKLSVTRIEVKGKAEVASAADRAKPGDLLEYSTRFANRGDSSAEGFTPSMPIPLGTEYVPGGNGPAPTHASLDGVNVLPIPLHRTERGADGKSRDVEVPAGEYRSLRWSVGTLNAGAEVTVRARVRISPAPTVAETAAAATPRS